MSTPDTAGNRQRGMLAALTAFLIWGGIAPLYFKAVGLIPPAELVAHRVLWSLLFLGLLLAGVRATGGFGHVRSALRDRRLFGLLALTSLLTSSNWLVFVWSVDAGRLIEASLGYFINPLFSVVLGGLFLGERLRPLQAVAVAVAGAGVLWRVWQVGSPPWIPLFLAATFGLYGLLRKRAPIDAISGLFVETLIVAPIAIGWLLWCAASGSLHAGTSTTVDLLLPLSGLITAIPLMLFAVGARRLPLATLGFLQYVAPSLSFLLAVLAFGEPFDTTQLLGFVMIWVALAIYSVDLLRVSRKGA